jgi:hypothetical protein
MADDEHPPIAHPGPLGIVELPWVEIVGRPASTFRSSPPPVAPPPHAPIVSSGDAGDTMSESGVFAQDPPNSIASERWRFVVGDDSGLFEPLFFGDAGMVDALRRLARLGSVTV